MLAEYIAGQLSKEEANGYHQRAIEYYRREIHTARCSVTVPAELAASRIAEHVLAAEGERAFAKCVFEECGLALLDLGRLDTLDALIKRAMDAHALEEATLASLHQALAIVKFKQGEIENAIQELLVALDINRKIKNKAGIAAQLGKLGQIKRDFGDLRGAEAALLESLELSKGIGREDLVASGLSDLACICVLKKDLRGASKLYQEARTIFESHGNLVDGARCLSESALIEARRGEYDRAERLMLSACEVYRDTGFKVDYAITKGNLAVLYIQKEMIDKAEEFAKESLHLFEEFGQPREICGALAVLGDTYSYKKDWKNAEKLYTRSFDIAFRLRNSELLQKIVLQLLQVKCMTCEFEVVNSYCTNLMSRLRSGGMASVANRILSRMQEFGKRKVESNLEDSTKAKPGRTGHNDT